MSSIPTFSQRFSLVVLSYYFMFSSGTRRRSIPSMAALHSYPCECGGVVDIPSCSISSPGLFSKMMIPGPLSLTTMLRKYADDHRVAYSRSRYGVWNMATKP